MTISKMFLADKVVEVNEKVAQVVGLTAKILLGQ